MGGGKGLARYFTQSRRLAPWPRDLPGSALSGRPGLPPEAAVKPRRHLADTSPTPRRRLADAAPTPRRRRADASPTPRRRLADASPTPRRRHAPTPRRRHADATPTPRDATRRLCY